MPGSPRRPNGKAFQFRTQALSQDELKQQAAWRAVEYVKSGTAIGLGTGSTAAFAVARIGQLLTEGKLKDIVAVPTSIKTYEQAKSAHRLQARRLQDDTTCTTVSSDLQLVHL